MLLVSLLFAFIVADPPPRLPDPHGYVCYRALQPIAVDGKLDDSAWASAPWSEPFVDIEGDAKPKPRWKTRMKVLWDDRCLYIAAELEEPHLWGTLTEHDSIIFQDNDFEVFLDPDGDNHHYGELELNAKNTTWDLYLTKPYRDAGRALHAWEIVGLKTAVHLDGSLNDPNDADRGWTLEIAWPWIGLKELSPAATPPKDGDQWRINFSRVQWDLEVVDGAYRKVKGKPERNWVWSPQGVVDMHRPERWGYLQFSTAKPGTATFKPDPDRVVRDQLQRVYEAQREYRGKHGAFADSARALKLDGDFKNLRLERTRSAFEADLPSLVDPLVRWSIDQDSWIRKIVVNPLPQPGTAGLRSDTSSRRVVGRGEVHPTPTPRAAIGRNLTGFSTGTSFALDLGPINDARSEGWPPLLPRTTQTRRTNQLSIRNASRRISGFLKFSVALDARLVNIFL